ncbi:hypothetical protein FRC02_002909 [Tulasnella sp. 418]|nr:hypothetical protein FRC02_002909 [Tulasnella sp. 418]
MSFCSISSTDPEPATSPSPRNTPTPIGIFHAPLRRTYAFYVPRRALVPRIKPIQSITATSPARRSKAKKSKLVQRSRTSVMLRHEERDERDEEAQNEPEETIAPPAKRRKIKN